LELYGAFTKFSLGIMRKTMYNYKIKKINKVVDGDTIDLDIDLGFGITITQRVRLKGINTAETKTLNLEEKAKGLVAKEWLKTELSKKGEWIIETFKEDKYGRILGTLYLVGDPVTINERMLNEGIAKPFMV
jgi:micrococcal nuclease